VSEELKDAVVALAAVAYALWRLYRRERLRDGLRDLLSCAELNQDELEPETVVVVEEARRLLG
jgi:hypothetical protein